MEKFTLFRAFAEKIIGRPLESVEPQHLSGWQCVSALWPLNEQAGNPVTVVPPGFSDAQMTVAVALNLLHGMELPWPPQDRAGFDIPPASALGSLRPH